MTNQIAKDRRGCPRWTTLAVTVAMAEHVERGTGEVARYPTAANDDVITTRFTPASRAARSTRSVPSRAGTICASPISLMLTVSGLHGPPGRAG